MRALARSGHEPLAADTGRLSLAGWSRFARGTLRLPRPTESGYLDALARASEDRSIDVVLPTDDETMELLAGRRVIGRSALFTPSTEAFATARDKGATSELAKRAKVDTPLTLGPSSAAEVAACLQSFPLPALIKPRKGSGARGIRYAEDRQSLLSAHAAVHAHYPFPLVQEWIRPVVKKTHVCTLTLDGRVLACFTHGILREWPVRGGVGTLWQSVRDDEAIEATAKLLTTLRFTGIAMTEYVYSPDRGPVLMEINPRFWNTLALAIACGVDFPTLWVSAALGRPVEGPREWPVGRVAQWLVPGDVLNFIFNPRRFQQEIGYLPVGPRTHAIWRGDDPMPLVAMSLIMARGALNPTMWRYALRR